jgi:hypothetical protein
MKTFKALLVSSLLLGVAGQAVADCAADATVRDVNTAFAKGQKADKAGNAKSALNFYVEAQAYTCDPNPVAAAAAGRAAALAKPLGDAASAKGDHRAAFESFENGGHFKDADRALIAWTSAQPDDPELYEKARVHFDSRASASFRENEKTRLAITGAYSLDSSFVARVKSMPTTGVERALQAEARAFNDAYLQKRLELVQSRPENPLDTAATQQYLTKAQALQKQFPKDALGESQQALELVRRWGVKTTNVSESAAFERRRNERAQVRVTALTSKYAAAPDLLGAAKDYLSHLEGGSEAAAPRLAKIRSLAEKHGDAAANKQKLMLAVDYYRVAGADAKAERANEQMQARAQQQMQPAIDAAKRDAAAMAESFGNPEQIEAMKRQAEAMQRQLRESAAAKQTPAAKKSRDDLAKELGM